MVGTKETRVRRIEPIRRETLTGPHRSRSNGDHVREDFRNRGQQGLPSRDDLDGNRRAAFGGQFFKEKNVNRKLIRPSLTDLKDQVAGPRGQQRKKPAPPEQTNAENFYYVKQMQARTPMVVVLQDGEQIRGVIEWYDKTCLKVHRQGEPNLLVYKPSIKYLYKENDQGEKA